LAPLRPKSTIKYELLAPLRANKSKYIYIYIYIYYAGKHLVFTRPRIWATS
jgi:hypothetical protein